MRGEARVAIDLESELDRVEQDLADMTVKTRELAELLGEQYAIFRCENKRYDDGLEDPNSTIMALSRQTDKYIERIYLLEKRRRELLDCIGR